MVATLDDTIAHRQHTTLSWILSRQTFWVFVAVVIAFAYMSWASPPFLTGSNLYNITRNFTFTAIIALGMTIVIITGGIDLSVGSVLCLSSMVIAVVMHMGFSIYMGIGAALLTAFLVGTFNGVLIAYVGMPPFVVTLGMLSIARSLAMVTSGNQTVFEFGPDHQLLLQLGGGSLQIPLFGITTLVVAYPVIYTLILAALTGYILLWTKFGRYVFAIGGNEQAAILTGVPVKTVKLAVYIISALSAGICGIVETGWLGAVTTNLGTGMELQVIAATVIGGANLAGGSGTAIRRAHRSGADRTDPQQPRPAGRERLLAGCVHRQRHPARHPVRTHQDAARTGVADPPMPQIGNRTQGLRVRVVLGPGVALGPGKADLLSAIAETGALTAAAGRMNMSYKRAWSLVQELNRGFRTPLVSTVKGGAGGGGTARLTPLGQRVLARYRQMEAAANRAVASGIADLRRNLKAPPASPAPNKRAR